MKHTPTTRAAARIGAATLLGVVAWLPARADNLTQTQQAAFDQQIGQYVKIDPTRIDDASVAKIFTATFYRVKVSVVHTWDSHGKFSGSSSQSLPALLAQSGADFHDMELPMMSPAPMPTLLQLLNPAFKLQTENDARALQAALVVLYPSTVGERDSFQPPAPRHNGMKWKIVARKDFDRDAGFVCTTNAAGTLTAMQYDSNLR